MKGSINFINAKSMKEITSEIKDMVELGLELLRVCSEVDDSITINLNKFPIFKYNDTDEWLEVLMKDLFVSMSKKISQTPLSDANDVVSVLEDIGEDVYIRHYFEFLDEYDYHHVDEAIEVTDEFEENLEEYFLSIGIHSLKIHVPIICRSEFVDKYSLMRDIPYLVGDCYGISDKAILACQLEQIDINAEFVISIYYKDDEDGDSCMIIDADKVCDSLISTLKEYLEENNLLGGLVC